ncbi:hypothetical protein EMIT0324P_11153 [Pseudomonas chlororaphis]
MTIHSQYACAIDGSLRVHVPVRLYELTLKHHLLDQLGDFSHLLLEVLDTMPFHRIEWMLELIGQPNLDSINHYTLAKSCELQDCDPPNARCYV